MPENMITHYCWKKALLLKRPKFWPLYKINILGDGIEINEGEDSSFIAFKDIRILQLYKPSSRSYAFRIVPVHKKQRFTFSDHFAEDYTRATAQTAKFEKIVITINKHCVSCNPDVRYILGNRAVFITNNFNRFYLPTMAGLLLMLGICSIIKNGNPVALYLGISIAALYLLERKKPKPAKQKSYDPHLLIKSGIKALSFYRKEKQKNHL